MQHDEFIGQVQARAKLASRGDAERATRATLETLGERLVGGLAENISAELPPEIGEHLTRTTDQVWTSADRFDRDEFIRRVADRAGVDEPQAAYLAQVVLEVSDEATNGLISRKAGEGLPPELRGLITAGSTGKR